jgi:hypothetical protein
MNMMITAMRTLKNYLLTALIKESKASAKYNRAQVNVIFTDNIQRSRQQCWFLRKREVSSSLFEH